MLQNIKWNILKYCEKMEIKFIWYRTDSEKLCEIYVESEVQILQTL